METSTVNESGEIIYDNKQKRDEIKRVKSLVVNLRKYLRTEMLKGSIISYKSTKIKE